MPPLESGQEIYLSTSCEKTNIHMYIEPYRLLPCRQFLQRQLHRHFL